MQFYNIYKYCDECGWQVCQTCGSCYNSSCESAYCPEIESAYVLPYKTEERNEKIKETIA